MAGEMKTNSRAADAADADEIIIPVTLKIDIGAKSSMFCCAICLEIIQTPAAHRQCGHCGMTICTECIPGLANQDSCPVCRASTMFIANSFIHREIYPAVTKACPWPKCTVRMFDIRTHMITCPFRSVACPVCYKRVKITNIHNHMNSDCSIQWKDCVLEPASSFEHRLKNMSRRGNYCIFSLNPAGNTNSSDETTRLLYVWRRSKHKRNAINMFCIQLCAPEDEYVTYAVDHANKKFTFRVASFKNFELVNPIVTSADTLAMLAHVEIEPNVHLLTCGNDYRVSQPAVETFTGKLIEVLWSPTRAVFVDESDELRTIAIGDASSMSQIQPLSQTETNENKHVFLTCEQTASLDSSLTASRMRPYTSGSPVTVGRPYHNDSQPYTRFQPAGHVNASRFGVYQSVLPAADNSDNEPNNSRFYPDDVLTDSDGDLPPIDLNDLPPEPPLNPNYPPRAEPARDIDQPTSEQKENATNQVADAQIASDREAVSPTRVASHPGLYRLADTVNPSPITYRQFDTYRTALHVINHTSNHNVGQIANEQKENVANRTSSSTQSTLGESVARSLDHIVSHPLEDNRGEFARIFMETILTVAAVTANQMSRGRRQ
jgi:hypothetical protein